MMNEETWLAICFAIFVILAYRPMKKALIEFLDSKIKIIRDELHDAQHAKMEAEKEILLMHAELALAETQHQEMLVKARSELEESYNERMQELIKSIEYRTKEAQSRFKQMKLEAIADIEDAFLDLVVEAVTNHMRTKSSSKVDIQILDNAA